MVSEKEVLASLKKVKDPEIGESVVDLGFIRKVEIDKQTAKITMVLTTPFCPMASFIISDVERAILNIDGIRKVEVNLDFDNPWSPEMMDNGLRKKLGFDKK